LLAPPASGYECLRALERAGFRVRLQEGELVLLVRRDRAVSVPLAEHLRPEQLVAILQMAGIGVAEFTALLDE
jgi:hypothetical protein